MSFKDHLWMPLLLLLIWNISVYANIYVLNLPNGFPIGSRVIIKGTAPVNESYKAIPINFRPESLWNEPNDIDFHTELRYGTGHIYTNNYILGKKWQTGLEVEDTQIQEGKPFEIWILSEVSKFRVFLNSKHIVDFDYRMPLERIRYLDIRRASISSISFERLAISTWHFEKGFKPGKIILIKGIAADQINDEEFSIFFQSCSPKEGDCNIVLKMSVNFRQGKVINNSYQKGVGWGLPETIMELPIREGRQFVIAIKNEATHFKIDINDKEFCTFIYRLQPSEVTDLLIKNDVTITGISEI